MSGRQRLPGSAREKYTEIVRTLEANGVHKHALARDGSNHIVLTFERDGKVGRLVFAGTPGDGWRSLQQARGLVRTALRKMERQR